MFDLDPADAPSCKANEKAILKILGYMMESKNIEMPDWEFAVRYEKVYVKRLVPEFRRYSRIYS